jgi:hypothetical protein
MLLAGSKVSGDRIGDDRISPVGTDALPYRVAGTVPVLPRVGNHGALVDLESAVVASVATTTGAAAQVWLTADAPSSIVDKLTGAGLTVVDEDSVRAQSDRFASQGPSTVLRYLVFSALAGMLLAAGSLNISAEVDRRPRAVELATLRVQGLPEVALRQAAHARPAVLVLAAVLAGAFSSVLAKLVVQPSLPVFTDGWRVLPIDTGPRPGPLLLAIGAAAVILVGSTVAVTGRMIRAAGGDA